MNETKIFGIGFLILVAILIPVVIVLTRKKEAPANNPYSSFSVVPDTSAYTNTTSIPVTSLSEAQNICLSKKDCKSFTYSETGQIMSIIDLKSSKFKQPGVHLFTLQTGINN